MIKNILRILAIISLYMSISTTSAIAQDNNEIAIGDANAPVTVYEFASLTCPHCANFHNNMYPEFKKQLIDTGKARYVMVDFPLDNIAFMGAVIGRCAGNLYYNVIDWLYKNQQAWLSSPDPVAYLQQGAQFFGIDDAKFQACLQDKSIKDNIFAKYQQAQEEFRVNSTPSFVINGKKITVRSLDDLIEAVEDAS